MHKHFLSVAALSMGLLTATLSQASPYSVDLGLGYGQTGISGLGGRSGVSYFVDGNYTLYRYLSAQINFTTFPSVGSLSHNNYAFGGNIKGQLPITPAFDAFARLGLGFTHSAYKSDATVLGRNIASGQSFTNGTVYWGMGTDYHMAPHIGLVAQWLRYNQSGANPSRWALLTGIHYSF